MLFVGSSLSRLQFSSLLNLLNGRELKPGEPAPLKDDLQGFDTRGQRKNAYGYACKDALFMRAFGTPSMSTSYIGNDDLEDYTEWIHTFDIVLLEMPLGRLRLQDRVANFWKKALLPHQRVIVRSGIIGHEHTGVTYDSQWNASDISPVFLTRPHNEPLQDANELIAYFKTICGHKGWLNNRLEQERDFDMMRSAGMQMFGAFYFSAMMWARHQDPLHWCLPGPPDMWNEVLFNYLTRGHIDDYVAWANALSHEISAKGGLSAMDGAPFRLLPETAFLSARRHVKK